MRVRTLLSLGTGAAVGAGAMYLLDPDHGPSRRREVRSQAVRQARAGAVSTATDLRRRAGEVVVAAVAGYQGSRGGSPPVGSG